MVSDWSTDGILVIFVFTFPSKRGVARHANCLLRKCLVTKKKKKKK